MEVSLLLVVSPVLMEVSGSSTEKAGGRSEPYVANVKALRSRFADPSNFTGCWGPCYTMSSHAALGVVRAGVAALRGVKHNLPRPKQLDDIDTVCRFWCSNQLHFPWTD